jgi:hypothetical protein
VTKPLKSGDFVEVRCHEQTGLMVREVWKAAIVIDVGLTSMLVQLMKEKELRIYLPLNEYGNMWR